MKKIIMLMLALLTTVPVQAAPLKDKDNSVPIIKSNRHTFMPKQEQAATPKRDRLGHPLYSFNHKHLGVRYKLRPFIHHGERFYECPQCHSARQCGHYSELSKVLRARKLVRNHK